MPLMRIPYTAPLPILDTVPAAASSIEGAVDALANFLRPRHTKTTSKHDQDKHDKTLILSGAGLSVASGLADYRGTKGTYTLNKTYRPIYFHEFADPKNHEARKRYWARSFLGWTNLHRAAPNPAHFAIGSLARQGLVSTVVTQNVDSFHPIAHPELQTLELHGYLRRTICLSCSAEYDRDEFQRDLAKLNPAWETFLAEMIQSGALTTENPEERRRRGLKTNPDGDVEVPGVEYGTFRYPPCPKCLKHPPAQSSVNVDGDGGWLPTSTAGILKPAVIMFGESIRAHVRQAVEAAIDDAARMLIVGSSLATYSAWRLVKRAKEQSMPIAVINMGGVRGEENFFSEISAQSDGSRGVRCGFPLEQILPMLARHMERSHESIHTASSTFQPAPWR